MCNEVEIDYDTEGYKNSLEKLVTMSEKEYYTQMVDINRHQVIVARNLLWLAIIIIGFNFTYADWIFSKVQIDQSFFSTMIASYFFTFIALISALLCFGWSVFSIPASGGYDLPYNKSWADYSKIAYEKLMAGSDEVYEHVLTSLHEKIDQACSRGHATNNSRGVKLRNASISIIVSAISSVIALFIFCFNYYL